MPESLESDILLPYFVTSTVHYTCSLGVVPCIWCTHRRTCISGDTVVSNILIELQASLWTLLAPFSCLSCLSALYCQVMLLPGMERAVDSLVVEFLSDATPVLFRDLLLCKALGIPLAFLCHWFALLTAMLPCSFIAHVLLSFTNT